MIKSKGVVAILEDITLRYGKTVALDDVTLAVPRGSLTGLIGPDGVGKSSLLAIIAGARKIQSGRVYVLDADIAVSAVRATLCRRIAYMPQGLGRNLYPDLTVRESIEFFGRLFGETPVERETRMAELLASTGLAPFVARPTRQLSGGMKQKLGLCCSLIHDPDLLILDEPTTGVDPLSRRQFWRMIEDIRARHPTITVLVATAYMEEAERFDWLVAVNKGKIVATGSPTELCRATGASSVEGAFIDLLPERERAGYLGFSVPQRRPVIGGESVIEAEGLTRRFGDFTAVDRVSFTIDQGEIFGFVGSNGCGKTTTMKMLTGLLPPSQGEVRLFGRPLDAYDLNARKRVGYMSQAFSLYAELTVRQNLNLHARLFHLPIERAKLRIAKLLDEFGLTDYVDARAQNLPLGIRQRLSLAVAIVHEPDLLILDEPTSGVDPIARDQFWEILVDLARNRSITIFVSTHFMNEAERCDRVSLMDSGHVLATDTPAGLMRSRNAATLEEAFIDYLEEAEAARSKVEQPASSAWVQPRREATPGRGLSTTFSPQRLVACTIRETLELIRDKVRLGFAIIGTTFLMLVFGFGISTDVNSLTFAVLDHDHSHESRAYLEALRGSTYFIEKRPLADYNDLEKRLASGDIDTAIEIPPNFGRDLARGLPTSIAAWVDGARPFIAQTIRGYLQDLHQLFLNDPMLRTGQPPVPAPAVVQLRFKYNQNLDSIYAMVPAQLALQLALFPAILMALSVVREKELGSITNLYVTPLTRLEFLLGKQIPYVGLAMINFALMFTLALIVFRVPLKGSFPTLLLGTLVYVVATTAYGMLISGFARTQIAALFGTAILTVLPATMFAGMLVPVSSLAGMARIMGRIFPMSYYLPISVGTFTKGLGFHDLSGNILTLLAFIPALTALSLLLLRKQER
ncbi:ribosome-associated ATPase/putative transporter RbbA [Microvirga alba]|uniref:Ribosome-associated ATPase/putative transporter RbbA n=1 Tax=Microvirga alba TaxID=2791025 RepID=A0A931BMA6_9HYPH|nr:ribosome-associated ATPase/putative transporter RbbA [Microvirga alba]MBF9233486.1 ribosome-associated ATPase/putative transporter RbbA [Microvirga alba]